VLSRLMSALFVETFRALHKDHLIHPESPIKNIGMIAGLACLGKDEDCVESETWFDRIVGMCRHGGVEVRVTPDEIGEQELIKPYLKEDEEYHVEDEVEWADPEDEDDEVLMGFDAIVSCPPDTSAPSEY